MRDAVIALGVAMVLLGGSGMDSPNILLPISIVLIGGVIAAVAGIRRG